MLSCPEHRFAFLQKRRDPFCKIGALKRGIKAGGGALIIIMGAFDDPLDDSLAGTLAGWRLRQHMRGEVCHRRGKIISDDLH